MATNRKRLPVLLGLVIALVISTLTPAGANNGVDDLRGRWDLSADLDGFAFELRMLVEAGAPDPNDANAFIAAGCVESLETGLLAPMSLRAVDLGGGSLDVRVFTTIEPEEGSVSVGLFEGIIELGGRGVADDTAAGGFQSDFGEGTWSGTHHDRRKPKCGDLEPGALFFGGDVYTVVGAEGVDGSVLEGFTQIVAASMEIQSPTFGTLIAPPFTDLFSPTIDFVSEFRFLIDVPEAPAAGEVVSFVLLDVFGDPIPGTAASDTWNGCFQSAPSNLGATYTFEEHIDFSWDAVPVATGFDPGSGLGFYQFDTGEGGYGGNSDGATTSHLIPWDAFGGFAPGSPDGFDFGLSLSEHDDGVFDLNAIAFAIDVGPGGFGLSCQVRGAPLTFEKAGSAITIPAP